jgi:hypothetical protein
MAATVSASVPEGHRVMLGALAFVVLSIVLFAVAVVLECRFRPTGCDV